MVPPTGAAPHGTGRGAGRPVAYRLAHVRDARRPLRSLRDRHRRHGRRHRARPSTSANATLTVAGAVAGRIGDHRAREGRPDGSRRRAATRGIATASRDRATPSNASTPRAFSVPSTAEQLAAAARPGSARARPVHDRRGRRAEEVTGRLRPRPTWSSRPAPSTSPASSRSPEGHSQGRPARGRLRRPRDAGRRHGAGRPRPPTGTLGLRRTTRRVARRGRSTCGSRRVRSRRPAAATMRRRDRRRPAPRSRSRPCSRRARRSRRDEPPGDRAAPRRGGVVLRAGRSSKLFTALIIGSDVREGDPKRGRADSLHLLVVEHEDAGPARSIGIPRDSYVTIPGRGTNKINASLVLRRTRDAPSQTVQGAQRHHTSSTGPSSSSRGSASSSTRSAASR